jgi:hypothetical protein
VTRDQLLAALRTILAGHVGTYDRGDGTTTPAIWVGAKVPAEYKISPTEPRVEVILLKSAETTAVNVHHGQVIERDWVVLVKAWGTTGVTACVERLLASAPGSRAGPLIAESDLTIEQQRVFIPDDPVGYARQ